MVIVISLVREYINFDESECKVGPVALFKRTILTLQSHRNCLVPQ